MGNKAKKKKVENHPNSAKPPIAMGFPYAPSLMVQSNPITSSGIAAPVVLHSRDDRGLNTPEMIVPSNAPAPERRASPVVPVVPDIKSEESLPHNIANAPTHATAPTGAPSEDIAMRCISLREGSALLICSKACTRYISGVCNVTLLHGKANINGYKLKARSPMEVRCPVWTPACRIFLDRHSPPVPSSSSTARQQSQVEFVSQLCRLHPCLHSIRTQLITEIDTSLTLLLCQSEGSLVSTDWLLLAEDYSSCAPPSAPQTEPPLSVCLPLAAIRPAAEVVASGLEYTSLPQDWVSAMDAVCKDIKQAPVALLCGAKGVGK